jgi:ABC-type uncharacterized transport system involved in gliding motility auxiliary subunit
MTNKNHKFQWRINHYLSIFFLIVIFVAVNMIGYKKPYRIDYSANQFLKISEQSLNILKNLKDEIEIISFMAPQSEDSSKLIQNDLQNLLKEYEYRSKGKIKVRYVNPFTEYTTATELANQFKITKNENVLIVRKGDQSKVVKLSELADIDETGVYYNQPPKVKTFKAEAVITGTLLSLIQGNKKQIYFTTGHGESSIQTGDDDMSGLSSLAARLKGQNAELHIANLLKDGISEKVDLLVIAGPKNPFLEEEVAMLKDYLNRKGKLLIFLEPKYTTNLEKLLESYGIIFQDDIVLRKVLSLSTQMNLQQGLSQEAVAVEFSATHPAIQWIAQTGAMLELGPSRSIQITPGPKNEKTPEVVELMKSEAADWGEVHYQNISTQPPKFDPATDHKGPLTLAVAIDTGSVQGGQVDLGGTRVIAVGAARFLENRMISTLHSDFVMNSVNWLMNQRIALGITPKAPREFVVTLTDDARKTISFIVMILIPLLGICLGALVWWRRRN